MLLSPHDAELFFRLHRTLLGFANERLHVLPDNHVTPADVAALPPANLAKVRVALHEHPNLIDTFVHDNPAHLPADELAVVASWRHRVVGKFYIFRELAKYTVFLSSASPPVAYGVVALTDTFESLVGPYLPIMVDAILLPFKDKIIYDGMLHRHSISFGAGIRRMLDGSYKAAKERQGIVTRLPVGSTPPPAPRTARVPTKKPATAGDVHGVLTEIVGMTDQFCRLRLNAEYAGLCRKLAEKLARKRPSPLLSGEPRTWACGIVRALGWMNFLHDRSQTPHMKSPDINRAFGVGESTAQGKSMQIRKLVKMSQFDWHWLLPSRMASHPAMWLVSVNGFILDIRTQPREVQVAAFEKGLIPYVPADRGPV